MGDELATASASIVFLLGLAMLVIGVALIHGSRRIPAPPGDPVDDWWAQDTTEKDYPRGIHG